MTLDVPLPWLPLATEYAVEESVEMLPAVSLHFT